MTLSTRWIVPAPRLATAWFGPSGEIEAMATRAPDAKDVPVVIGPRGPKGEAGGGVRFDVSTPSASWIIPHGFGRVPIVSVYLSTGEQVLADVSATATTINVVMTAPRAGFVIAA